MSTNKDEVTDLLLCPFCGSSSPRNWGGYVECDNDSCCALGPNGKDDKHAAKLWNRRVASTSEVAQAPALGLLKGWYEANAAGTVMVEDKAYRLVTETAALLAAPVAPTAEQAEAVRVGDFVWPPLPTFPESFAHVAGHAYFTEHQMQGYANAYGEAVLAYLAARSGDDAAPTPANGRPLAVNLSQAQQLVEFFGGDSEIEIALQLGDKGHAGAGLYAWFDEYPEEGAMFLDAAKPVTDDTEAMTDEQIRKSMTTEQIQLERKLTCEAIDGAIAFGYQNTNPPPSDDHWLAPFWKIGRRQAELEASVAPTPETGQLDAETPGTRMQIQDLIDKLVSIRDRFGNTAVYLRPNSVGWGATALNWQYEDQEASLAATAASGGDQEVGS